MSDLKLNSRFKHIYVVLRVDDYCDIQISEKVVGTKAFYTRDEAIAEVARLNNINAAKGCIYFWVLARI